jgi:hypothetical protein
LSSVAFCQPVNTAVASEPTGKEAVMTATMAVSLSQPATCKSTDTPPRGTERVVRSGLQGNCALRALPSKAMSRQFCAGVQALNIQVNAKEAAQADECFRMG